MATAPGKSNVRAPSSERLSPSARGASAAAAIPIGTLTNSTQRQFRPLVRIPPNSTPAAPPAPTIAPQTPSARLRSAPSAKVVVRIDSAAGETIAAPRPWTARAASRHPSDWGTPPANAAAEQRGHPAAQHQKAAEGERVGVHAPREVRAREVQRPPDRRQRDVHDRGVDHDHELRHRQQQQREVLRAGGVEGGRHGYSSAWPPSTTRSTPLVKLASSDARYNTAAAISSGRPMRPIGLPAAIPARMASAVALSGNATSMIGVSTGPGLTTLTRMLRSFRSAAHVRAKDRIAALLAE